MVACTATDGLGRGAQCAFPVTLTAQILSVTRFLAFGDSFTEGQNGRFDAFGNMLVDVPNAYPTRLQEMLNLEYPGQDIAVANRGDGGKDVHFLLNALPAALRDVKPGALLLLAGYNNLLGRCPWPSAASAACHVEINEVVVKLRDSIRIARQSQGVTYVFVSTLTPPGPYVGGSDRRIAPDAIVQTNARLAPMVLAEGAILVDTYPRFVGHEAEYVAEDGLHLRPAGYQALAAAFFDAIKATVSSTPALMFR
jgi:lysophospholipase L1-like esterase